MIQKMRLAFLFATLAVVRLEAVKIEGVDVDDAHPLTQKHCPVFLERFQEGA